MAGMGRAAPNGVMPEVTAWTCSTNLRWSCKVEASSGKHFYDVTYRSPLSGERGTFAVGYHCSCPAFQYGGGNYCKHIKAVQRDSDFRRCGWNEQGDPMAVPDHGGPDNRPVCPRCSADAAAISAPMEVMWTIS